MIKLMNSMKQKDILFIASWIKNRLEIYSSSSFKCAKNYSPDVWIEKKKEMPRVPLNCNNIIPTQTYFILLLVPVVRRSQEKAIYRNL